MSEEIDGPRVLSAAGRKCAELIESAVAAERVRVKQAVTTARAEELLDRLRAAGLAFVQVGREQTAGAPVLQERARSLGVEAFRAEIERFVEGL